MTIGQVAEKAHVSIETVRYYERRGLVPEPPRSESGYRQYSDDAISRIKFIKSAQELGFTLNEISDLLTLRVDPQTTCGDVKERTEIKIDEIEEKIQNLESIRKALTELVVMCEGQGPKGECPIIEVLDNKGQK